MRLESKVQRSSYVLRALFETVRNYEVLGSKMLLSDLYLTSLVEILVNRTISGERAVQ